MPEEDPNGMLFCRCIFYELGGYWPVTKQNWNTRPIEDALRARIAELEKQISETLDRLDAELNTEIYDSDDEMNHYKVLEAADKLRRVLKKGAGNGQENRERQ
jgi:hypothetical protein